MDDLISANLVPWEAVTETAEASVTGNDRAYEDFLRSGHWELESVLPPCLECLLALRKACQDSFDTRGERFTERKLAIEPECRTSEEIGQFFVPRLYPPMFGYPIKVEQNYYTLRPLSGAGLAGMMKLVQEMRAVKSVWIPPLLEMVQISEQDLPMRRVISCYDDVPLHAFTVSAVEELNRSAGPADVWRAMYDGMSDATRRPGIWGVLRDNTVIDVRAYESADEGTDISRSVEARQTKRQWRHFIDCIYTPAGLEAGKIRSLSHGVLFRVCTGKTLMMADELLELVHKWQRFDSTAGFVFHFAGLTCAIHEQAVDQLVTLRSGMRGREAPTLHVFSSRKLVSMSVTSGELVKPARVTEVMEPDFHDDARFIDSLTYNDSDLWESASITHARTAGLIHDVRTLALTCPFLVHDEPPRPLLGTGMSVQAICMPRTELSSTVAPLQSFQPLVMTRLTKQINAELTDPRFKLLNIPGVPLVVVFANMQHNYEDAVIINKSVNDRALFAHRGVIYHNVPMNEAELAAGSTVGEGHNWWRPAGSWTVIAERISKNKLRHVVASIKSTCLEVGDKISTIHGQKFTVSQVLTSDEMPTFTCNTTGRRVIADMIVASSSIHNRGTVGQVYECWAGRSACEPEELDSARLSGRLSVTTECLQHDTPPEAWTCRVQHHGQLVLSPVNAPIIADYGICQVWQSVHLARDKQHYMSDWPKGAVSKRGRLKGAAVRHGEMESLSMLAGGLIHSLSYLSDASDMCCVTICSACKRLSVLCDCLGVQPPTTEVAVRSSLVKFDIHRAVYAINGAAGVGRLETAHGKHTSEPMIAESLQYLAEF